MGRKARSLKFCIGCQTTIVLPPEHILAAFCFFEQTESSGKIQNKKGDIKMKKYIRLMVASAFVFNIAFGTTNVVLADKPNDNGKTTGQSTLDEPKTTNFVHLHLTGDAAGIAGISKIMLNWTSGDPTELVKQGGIYSCDDSKKSVGGSIGSITIFTGDDNQLSTTYYANTSKELKLGIEADGTINIWIEYTAPTVEIPEDPGPGGSIIPPTDPGTGGTGTTDNNGSNNGSDENTNPGGTGTGGTTDQGTGGTTDPGTGTNTGSGSDNNNNNGNGNGGNGTVTIIDDEDPVPTGEANLPSGNNSNTGNGQQEVASAGNNNSGTNKQVTVIEDEETPLGSLPQTGGIPFEDFVFLGTGLTALGFVIRRKR
jgi:LPXTG-motif cell wall-anchored protein